MGDQELIHYLDKEALTTVIVDASPVGSAVRVQDQKREIVPL